MSLVREVFEQITEGVTGTLKTPIAAIPSLTRLQKHSSDGSTTVSTLGIRPVKEVEEVRGSRSALEGMPPCAMWEVDITADVAHCVEFGLNMEFAGGEW